MEVQWLGLRTFTAEGSIPGWGTKIPKAAQDGRKRKKKMWKNKFQPTRVKGIPRMRMKGFKIDSCAPGTEDSTPSLDWNRSEGSRREFFRKMATNRILDKCIRTI